MGKIRQKAGTAVAMSVLAAGVGAAAGSAPAAAATHRCGTIFTSIPYNQTGTVLKSVSFAGRINVKLVHGVIGGHERLFARVDGNTRVGDQVWLDWSYTGGNGWAQCGPYNVQSNGSPNTTGAAFRYPANHPVPVFRACGLARAEGIGGCTAGWWPVS